MTRAQAIADSQEFVAAMVEIADRIEEAWDVLQRLPNAERKWLRTTVTAWPGMLPERFIDYAPERTIVQRPPPTAAQISRAHEVLNWMVALAKADRDHARVLQLCFGQRRRSGDVAKLMGKGKTTIKRWRHEALRWLAAHVEAQKTAA